jgi:hypothetical protein
LSSENYISGFQRCENIWCSSQLQGLHEPMNTETIWKKKYRTIGQEAINPDGSFTEN